MKRHIFLYGLGGLLIAALKFIEHRFLVVEHAFEIYGGLIALVFASLGIWLGLELTRKTPETVVIREILIQPAEPFVQDEDKLRALGITRRDLEILEAIAAGTSASGRTATRSRVAPSPSDVPSRWASSSH